MQQDLDIRLEGQLSDRIKVNLLQNSANQIPLANRIAINYRGDEDDLVQALDLGNTNLTLPGHPVRLVQRQATRACSASRRRSRFGPLDFTMLASKQEGRSERASLRRRRLAADADARATSTTCTGVYFFLYDPNLGDARHRRTPASRSTCDDADYDNERRARCAAARCLDPTRRCRPARCSDTAGRCAATSRS